MRAHSNRHAKLGREMHFRQPGGFREIRIPGVHVRELLRPPVITARALAGTDLQRDSLSYVFERATGDDPFRRDPTGSTTVLNSAMLKLATPTARVRPSCCSLSRVSNIAGRFMLLAGQCTR